MPSVGSSLYAFGDFRLDARNRVLRRGGQTVPLSPKSFEVLWLLVERRGEVVGRDQLMQSVWRDTIVEDSNLTQTIFMLRKALGETTEHRYILTVPARGYRFAAEVEEISNKSSPSDEILLMEAPTASSRSIGRQAPRMPTTGPSDRQGGRPSWLYAVALVAFLTAVTIAYVQWSGLHRKAREPSSRLMLAVLPFQNLSGDVGQDYLSDGLTEEMITRLGQLDAHRLGVIARTSVMHYKNSQASLDQIGRDLGVQYVLEGSVRRDAEMVRVSAQLIQVSDQTHLWARQYDRELSSLLVLQGEVAQEIADEIQLTLGDHPKWSAPTHPASSPSSSEAYDLYLKGQFFWNKRTIEGFEEAIDCFQQAIAKDPKYARAYAGLADSYALLGGYSQRPQLGYMSKARAAALRALELDERLPEAHTALAVIVQNYDWDWQAAEKEFRRAIELNPNYATAHHWYAEHLAFRGRFDESLIESEYARQLDPLSLIIAADNGAILYYSRQYNRAIAKFNAVLAMDSNFPRAHMVRAAYVAKGRFEDALADIEKSRPVEGERSHWGWLAYVYGRAGRRTEAEHALARLLEINRHESLDPAIILWAYLGIGDNEQALAWLEKSYTQHSNSLTTLKVEPVYDRLRGDPRFQELTRRVGLAQ
jgi:TolB-like protein/DNA-binding winged helix-turn-helix (wHTH) protein/Tfp pilus assembly protein PilF